MAILFCVTKMMQPIHWPESWPNDEALNDAACTVESRLHEWLIDELKKAD